MLQSGGRILVLEAKEDSAAVLMNVVEIVQRTCMKLVVNRTYANTEETQLV